MLSQQPRELDQNNGQTNSPSSAKSVFGYTERELDIHFRMYGALLGEIGPNMRQIDVNFGDNWLHIVCYVDGSIQEEDEESISCVETEMLAAYPESHKISYEMVRLDFPKRLPKDRSLPVYRRREDTEKWEDL